MKLNRLRLAAGPQPWNVLDESGMDVIEVTEEEEFPENEVED